MIYLSCHTNLNDNNNKIKYCNVMFKRCESKRYPIPRKLNFKNCKYVVTGQEQRYTHTPARDITVCLKIPVCRELSKNQCTCSFLLLLLLLLLFSLSLSLPVRRTIQIEQANRRLGSNVPRANRQHEKYFSPDMTHVLPRA